MEIFIVMRNKISCSCACRFSSVKNLSFFLFFPGLNCLLELYLDQAWDIYYHVFRKIDKQLQSLTTLDLEVRVMVTCIFLYAHICLLCSCNGANTLCLSIVCLSRIAGMP